MHSFAELFVEHVELTGDIAFAQFGCDDSTMNAKLKKLLHNAQEMQALLGVRGLFALLKEHILLVGALIDAKLKCRCKVSYSGFGSCANAKKAKKAIDGLTSNMKKVATFMENATNGALTSKKVSHWWGLHLDCTNKYITHLSVANLPKFEKEFEKCIKLGGLMGIYFDTAL